MPIVFTPSTALMQMECAGSVMCMPSVSTQSNLEDVSSMPYGYGGGTDDIHRVISVVFLKYTEYRYRQNPQQNENMYNSLF